MKKKITISASILSADFARLADDVKRALDAGADYIHLDVMDRHFVPNLSFGAVVCKALRKAGISAPFDAHFMVENPERYVEEFAEAGADFFSFHPETTEDPVAVVRKIRAAEMQAGLVFNPDKPVVIPKEIASELGMILLMSVFPGFSGQKFIPAVLDKVRAVRKDLDQRKSSCFLALDGGVKIDNAKEIIEAGADFLIVGSGLFDTPNYVETIKGFRDLGGKSRER